MWVTYIQLEGFYRKADGRVVAGYIYLVQLRPSKTGSLNGRPFAYVPPVITKRPAYGILWDPKNRRSLELIIFPNESLEEIIRISMRKDFLEIYKNRSYIMELDKRVMEENGLEENKIYILKVSQVPGLSSPF